jgi:hypothetical protein
LPANPAALANSYFVRQRPVMVTNTRNFIRGFSSYKAKARQGATIHVHDKEGVFHFTAVSSRKSLVGCARGKIQFAGDLTKPTLPNKGWKPSL